MSILVMLLVFLPFIRWRFLRIRLWLCLLGIMRILRIILVGLWAGMEVWFWWVEGKVWMAATWVAMVSSCWRMSLLIRASNSLKCMTCSSKAEALRYQPSPCIDPVHNLDSNIDSKTYRIFVDPKVFDFLLWCHYSCSSQRLKVSYCAFMALIHCSDSSSSWKIRCFFVIFDFGVQRYFESISFSLHFLGRMLTFGSWIQPMIELLGHQTLLRIFWKSYSRSFAGR